MRQIHVFLTQEQNMIFADNIIDVLIRKAEDNVELKFENWNRKLLDIFINCKKWCLPRSSSNFYSLCKQQAQCPLMRSSSSGQNSKFPSVWRKLPSFLFIQNAIQTLAQPQQTFSKLLPEQISRGQQCYDSDSALSCSRLQTWQLITCTDLISSSDTSLPFLFFSFPREVLAPTIICSVSRKADSNACISGQHFTRSSRNQLSHRINFAP